MQIDTEEVFVSAVGVNLQSGVHVGVAQQSLNCLRVRPCSDQKRGKRVTKIVEAKPDRFPLMTKLGEQINNVYDLEIGFIEFQLTRFSFVTFQELEYIADLKNARNALSHFEPVNPQLALKLCATQSFSDSDQYPHLDYGIYYSPSQA
jgi:hypothetical protein